MSRKSKRLRQQNAKLRETIPHLVESLQTLAKFLEQERARVEALRSELAKWKPRVAFEESRDVWQLRYAIAKDVLKYAREPRVILDAALYDLRVQLEDAMRSGEVR